ncbi:MAG: cation:dicarboxylase symporter family transporter [Gemmatimonadales bacterium]|nr:cation:dicarboxylase symporter family transporter [Gemmatimonadales bacterium]
MSLTSRVLAGLVAGLIGGIALVVLAPPAWRDIAMWIEPIGTLWTRGLQMTVLPLVVSLLFVAVIGGGNGIGTLGLRAIVVFAILLVIVAGLTVLVAPALFDLFTINPSESAAQAANEATVSPELPGVREWLVGLIPTNIIAAGASGMMLPVIVATLLFGAAAARVPGEYRDQLLAGANAICAMTLVLVRWVLSVAPIGVFALALPLAVRLGVTALGAVVAYVVVTAVLTTAVIGALYLLVMVRGSSVRLFARAVAPAQGIAISARSSLAALPALIDGAALLGLSPRIAAFFMPFSTSLFRLGAGVALPVGVLFVARLYGVALGPAELMTIAVTSVAVSFSAPSIPGGSILIMAPVLLSVGLPVEGLGILLGVDTIPDMFRTTVNVTATMATAVIVGDSADDSGLPRSYATPIGTPIPPAARAFRQGR